MKSLMILLLCALATQAGAQSSSEKVPLVYSVENTGSKFAAPEMPAVDAMPESRQLPDPLEWSDGKGKVNGFAEWSRRRSEIAHEIQHYGIGYLDINRTNGDKCGIVDWSSRNYCWGSDRRRTIVIATTTE